METFGSMGERQMVEALRGRLRPPPGSWCPGDDAALVSGTVACVDTVTFERHMPPGMAPGQFGWMAAAVSLSDLATMGARPTGLLAAMLLPPETPADDVLEIAEGMDRCAESCGTHIYGGDTKPGAGSVSTTALGHMEGRSPMTRRGASPGEFVAVTGGLGGPASGYECLKNGWEATGGFAEAIRELYEPVPKVAEGILLSESGAATSCIDLSDGLATAANTVSVASGVRIALDGELLPASPAVREASERTGTPATELMTSFGGEYELMFTVGAAGAERLAELGLDFTVIGTVKKGAGVSITLGRGEERRLENGRY